MSMIMKNSREVVHVGLRRCYSNLQVFCVKRSESRSEEMFLELNWIYWTCMSLNF